MIKLTTIKEVRFRDSVFCGRITGVLPAADTAAQFIQRQEVESLHRPNRTWRTTAGSAINQKNPGAGKFTDILFKRRRIDIQILCAGDMAAVKLA